LQCPSNTTVQ
jgi:hypothetical protein